MKRCIKLIQYKYLCYKYDCEFWIRADPVRLEPDHQRVFMRGYIDGGAEGELILKDLLAKLNLILKQDNLELSYLTPTQWILKGYWRAPKLAKITSYSPNKCLNQDIRELLPHGEHQAYWRRLFTECQMIMQNHNNQDYNNKNDNNSLWFWRN